MFNFKLCTLSYDKLVPNRKKLQTRQFFLNARYKNSNDKKNTKLTNPTVMVLNKAFLYTFGYVVVELSVQKCRQMLIFFWLF
jgi:hypothetical protein